MGKRQIVFPAQICNSKKDSFLFAYLNFAEILAYVIGKSRAGANELYCRKRQQSR